MEYKTQIHFMEKREFRELSHLPEWARAEHMEICAPVRSFGGSYGPAEQKNPTLWNRFFDRIQ